MNVVRFPGGGRWRRRRGPSEPRRFYLSDLLPAIAIFVIALAIVARLDEVSTQTRSGQATVHDGDTVTISGQRMRLKGIDAPEYRQTCKNGAAVYECGKDSRRALANFAAGKSVVCEGWERDKYQRLLVRCREGALDINAEMVRQGWAVSYGDYRAQEREARTAKRGVWRGEFEQPQDWRAGHQSRDAEAPHDAFGSFVSWLRQLIWPAAPS